jgi:hypothetical protein
VHRDSHRLEADLVRVQASDPASHKIKVKLSRDELVTSLVIFFPKELVILGSKYLHPFRQKNLLRHWFL